MVNEDKKTIQTESGTAKSLKDVNILDMDNEELRRLIDQEKTDSFERKLKHVENDLSHRDLLINTLNSQLRQFEEQYKRNIQDTQEIRNQHAQLLHDYTMLKKIFLMSKEGSNKLSQQPNKESQELLSRTESDIPQEPPISKMNETNSSVRSISVSIGTTSEKEGGDNGSVGTQTKALDFEDQIEKKSEDESNNFEESNVPLSDGTVEKIAESSNEIQSVIESVQESEKASKMTGDSSLVRNSENESISNKEKSVDSEIGDKRSEDNDSEKMKFQKSVDSLHESVTELGTIIQEKLSPQIEKITSFNSNMNTIPEEAIDETSKVNARRICDALKCTPTENLNKALAEIEKLKEELDGKISIIDGYEKHIAEQQCEITSLGRKINEIDRGNRQEVFQLKDDVAEREMEIHKCFCKIDQLEKKTIAQDLDCEKLVREKEMLNNKIKMIKVTLQQYKEQIVLKEKENQQLERKNEEQASSIRKIQTLLQNKENEQSNNIEKYRNKFEGMCKKCENLTRGLSNLEEACENLKVANNKLQSEKCQNGSMINELKNKINELEDQIAQNNGIKSEADGLKDNIERWKCKCKDIKLEMEELRKLNDELKQQKENEVACISRMLDKQTERVKELEEEKQQLAEKLEETKATLVAMEESQNEHLLALQNINDSLEKDLEETQKEYRNVKAEYESQIEDLKQVIEKLQEENLELEAKARQLEKVQNENAVLLRRNQDLKKFTLDKDREIEEVRRQSVQIEEAFEELKDKSESDVEELREAKQKLDELGEMREKYNDAKKELENFKERYQKLENEMGVCRRDCEKEIREIRQQLKQLEAENTNLKEESLNSCKANDRKTLEDIIEKLKEENTNLKEESFNSCKANDRKTLEDIIEKLKEENDQLKRTQRAMIDSLQEKLSESKNERSLEGYALSKELLSVMVDRISKSHSLDEAKYKPPEFTITITEEESDASSKIDTASTKRSGNDEDGHEIIVTIEQTIEIESVTNSSKISEATDKNPSHQNELEDAKTKDFSCQSDDGFEVLKECEKENFEDSESSNATTTFHKEILDTENKFAEIKEESATNLSQKSTEKPREMLVIEEEDQSCNDPECDCDLEKEEDCKQDFSSQIGSTHSTISKNVTEKVSELKEKRSLLVNKINCIDKRLSKLCPNTSTCAANAILPTKKSSNASKKEELVEDVVYDKPATKVIQANKVTHSKPPSNIPKPTEKVVHKATTPEATEKTCPAQCVAAARKPVPSGRKIPQRRMSAPQKNEIKPKQSPSKCSSSCTNSDKLSSKKELSPSGSKTARRSSSASSESIKQSKDKPRTSVVSKDIKLTPKQSKCSIHSISEEKRKPRSSSLSSSAGKYSTTKQARSNSTGHQNLPRKRSVDIFMPATIPPSRTCFDQKMAIRAHLTPNTSAYRNCKCPTPNPKVSGLEQRLRELSQMEKQVENVRKQLAQCGCQTSLLTEGALLNRIRQVQGLRSKILVCSSKAGASGIPHKHQKRTKVS